MTAYVLKCLGKAKYLINIENKVLFEGLSFLKSKQEESGKFPEYGRISYYNLQTDSSEGIPLTAFTVIAFLENTDYVKDFKQVIDKALNYIDENRKKLDNNYALAIATYALALGSHSSANDSLNALEKTAFKTDQQWYWEKDMTVKKSQKKPTAESTMVEIAAYAILSYVKLKRSTEALPIVKWLVSRRNSGGGFSSTHDTVIGVQALAEIAHELYWDKLNMNIKLSFDNEEIQFELDDKNRNKPQSKKMPSTIRRISLNAEGSGIASVQVSHSYNTKIEEITNVFSLHITENPGTGANILQLKICAVYEPQDSPDDNKTGMALIEVWFPSGFVADPTFDLLELAGVKVL